MRPGPESPSCGPAPAALLAAFAAALADETRAAICMTLLEGRACTAGELARITSVAPSTISGDLTRLLDAGICVTERQGRHIYVRIADGATARLLDDLASHAIPDWHAAHAVSVVAAPDPLARARTCYDHFAGRLGMAVTDAMERRGLLRTEDVFELYGGRPGLVRRGRHRPRRRGAQAAGQFLPGLDRAAPPPGRARRGAPVRPGVGGAVGRAPDGRRPGAGGDRCRGAGLRRAAGTHCGRVELSRGAETRSAAVEPGRGARPSSPEGAARLPSG
ncbi:hypothetical protein SAVIM40S_02991 [Streptomyces avidinii]